VTQRCPTSTLFPYTTLFRSGQAADAAQRRGRRDELGPDGPLTDLRRPPGAVPVAADGGGFGPHSGSHSGLLTTSTRALCRVRRRSEEHTSELQSPDNLVFRL